MTNLKDREKIDPKYRWDLTKVFADDIEWEMEYEKIMKDLEGILSYKGKLSLNGQTLLKALNEKHKLQERYEVIYTYAMLKHLQDTKNNIYSSLYNKAESLTTRFTTIASFIKPEILAIGEDKIDNFISSTEGLEIYKQDFDNIFRRSKHTLSEKEEDLLSLMKPTTNLSNNLFNILNNKQVKFENAFDKDKNEVEVTHGNFIMLLKSNDRVLRESVYNSVFNSYISLIDSFAGVYAGTIKRETFFATARGYKSSLEASLYESNIPKNVYKNLVTTVGEGLKSLHKYNKIRKKCLGSEKLNPYDLYVPILADIDYKITYEEAKDIILKSLEPLGEEYIGIVKNIFESKYIDVYENQGKVPGAFSVCTYGVPPYILMSYTDDLKSLFTLTHELGHSVHTLYSSKNQPFIYSEYTLFLAEVASTTHEALLIEYLLKTTKNKKLKAYLLNYQINNYLSTFFRQTMLAEFEMRAHELEAKGIHIDADALAAIYKELLQKYFGEHLEIDDKIIYEWARISHFHNPFYVYQYATGFAAASSIAKDIIENGQSSADKFINMLKSGSSEYSLPLLKKAGVDMSTPKPIEDALAVFASLVDELEKLV